MNMNKIEDYKRRILSCFPKEYRQRLSSWKKDPILNSLHRTLFSQNDRHMFRDHLFECAVAMLYQDKGMKIKDVERQCSNGRCIDLVVDSAGKELFVHITYLRDNAYKFFDNNRVYIKKLQTLIQNTPQPILLSVHLNKMEIDPKEMSRFIQMSARNAKVGENTYAEVGSCEIVPDIPLKKSAVVGPMTPCIWSKAGEHFVTKFKKKYKQVVRGSRNHIIIGCPWDDSIDIESALYGRLACRVFKNGTTKTFRMNDGVWSRGQHSHVQSVLFAHWSAGLIRDWRVYEPPLVSPVS